MLKELIVPSFPFWFLTFPFPVYTGLFSWRSNFATAQGVGCIFPVPTRVTDRSSSTETQRADFPAHEISPVSRVEVVGSFTLLTTRRTRPMRPCMSLIVRVESHYFVDNHIQLVLQVLLSHVPICVWCWWRYL